MGPTSGAIRARAAVRPEPVAAPAAAAQPAAPASPTASAPQYPTRRSQREQRRREQTPASGVPVIAAPFSAPTPVIAPQAPIVEAAPVAAGQPPAGSSGRPAVSGEHGRPAVSGETVILPRTRAEQRGRRTAEQRAADQRAGQRRSTSLSAPQIGIAGALGIATIAAPLSGVLANDVPSVPANELVATAMAPAPDFPRVVSEPRPGVERVRVVASVDPTFGAAVPSALAAPREVLVTRASRAHERSVLPGCDGVVRYSGAANGQLRSSDLCTLWDPDHQLRADAAVALAKLNVAYKQAFGEDICFTDSYRTLGEQYALKAAKPGLAAVPGTSEHGWGMAVDLCDGVQGGSGPKFQWLKANGPAYGWDNPDWARSGGSGPYEPWHWEYVRGL